MEVSNPQFYFPKSKKHPQNDAKIDSFFNDFQD